MTYPADVVQGITTGHRSDHAALHLERTGQTVTIDASSSGHDGVDHPALKAWYDAAHPGSPLVTVPTDRVDPTYDGTHEQAHEALHAWRNSLGGSVLTLTTESGSTLTTESGSALTTEQAA